MASKSLSKVTWEVWVEFDWGTTSKLSYLTRKDARSGKKTSTFNHTFNGKLASYVKDIKMYKVTHLGGLSAMTGTGVYSVEPAR